jgi:hypothetical protein
MSRSPEPPEVKTARFRLMGLISACGWTNPRTAAAAVELARLRADAAEAEARRLREAANAMAAGAELADAS